MAQNRFDIFLANPLAAPRARLMATNILHPQIHLSDLFSGHDLSPVGAKSITEGFLHEERDVDHLFHNAFAHSLSWRCLKVKQLACP